MMYVFLFFSVFTTSVGIGIDLKLGPTVYARHFLLLCKDVFDTYICTFVCMCLCVCNTLYLYYTSKLPST